MVENDKITQIEIAKELCIGKTTVTRNLQILRENKVIERVGSDKSGTWKVNL